VNTIKPEKSNLLHELETLNEDNTKMYWKMINELQEKQTDSDNNNCISPTRWLKHFQSLNEVKEHFKSRIKDLEDKLKKMEGTNCFNELGFPYIFGQDCKCNFKN
jgi:predicted nucleic acid-binding OB-fold protein